MLRRLRIGISALLFVLISFFFLDFAEILPNSFHRLAHLQFVPAILSLSIGILLFLIVLTLLFGRVYCSTICPMGILQDVIARISKSTGKKKKRYSYSPAKNKLRWGILGLTVIGFLCGFTFIVGLLDPYSAYGRVVVHIFKPIYMLGTEIMGYTAAKDCAPADAPYNAEKDITFFEGLAETYVAVKPGMFAIFFPQDGHAPGITPDGVKKVIVKVKA